MPEEFKPMRSLIYVDVVKEKYRHKLLHWLHRYHVQDSISQFGPYVTKYAFYMALPTPPEGERFGTIRMQLTEHYWLVNPFTSNKKVKALTEYFPLEALKWQGTVPDTDEVLNENIEGDAARSSGGDKGMPPFLFAFVPVWWEEDFKGSQRTVEDGPNYRWQWTFKYPDGVSPEEGDKWFYNEVIPKFQAMSEVTRILTSKVIQSVNHCPFYRVVEMWFDGPDEWYNAAVVNAKNIAKPNWATQELFPYLVPRFEIQSVFLPDIAYSDNMTQHRGWITMR
jgi:hypothetical protein